MLTVDLVRATKRGGELKLSSLSGKTKERALELGAELLQLAQGHIGRTRDELREAVLEISAQIKEKKLLDGLAKLVDDACEFEVDLDYDPVLLRTRVFEVSAEARRGATAAEPFEREQVLARVAEELSLSPSQIEGALFADLRGAHVLKGVEALSSPALVERYEVSQRQAVLLKAVQVRADIWCRAPEDYRRLFRSLKFRRLLFQAEPAARGYRLTLNGPYSLFDSVTKYGLNLALALPELERCDELSLEADLKWGKSRQALVYKYTTKRRGDGAEIGELDELQQLKTAFAKLDSGWEVEAASELIELPGQGLIVPDLLFRPPGGGRPVYFELLGFWSRDAVWKRIEWARAGLKAPILFAASHRLRVSEELLSEVEQAELYLFKGSLSAKQILTRLQRLSGG